jgi:sugar phosphate isomerase/epimerase
MTKYQYGVELYSVRQSLDEDMPGTIAKLAGLGYKAVEFAGQIKYSARQINTELQKNGLACCGWHTPYQLLVEDKLAQTAEFFQAIGNRYAIIPGLPEDMIYGSDNIKRTAEWFSQLAEKLARYQINFGYHNHAGQLRLNPDGQGCPLTDLFDQTVDQVVVQIDNGHVINGRGFDLMQLARRYPGRLKTVHLKPYSLAKGSQDPNVGYQTMIGEDDVPWSDFMRFCRETGGTEWYIVEYEALEMYPELDGVAICLEKLLEMENQGLI